MSNPSASGSLSPTESSDAELIQRILGGERDGYGLIVGRYQEMLHRFATGMIGDPDAAADLVQDSFIKAYVALAQCRDRDNFRAWIFRMLRNRCTDYLRAPARRTVALQPELPQLMLTDTPDVLLERDQLRGVVQRALAGLPDQQREAFLLKHVEDVSYEEMSVLLGAGVSALKMRVMRAREALQRALRNPADSGASGACDLVEDRSS